MEQNDRKQNGQKQQGVNELRRSFLRFFEGKGHLVKSSFSLVPHNDNSLLLINAGMAPLKPYFTGAEIPPNRRMATCQKCIRTGDIENVGKTARHLTFFEMLGNFSFGDYFKKEAIAWSWEFLTETAGLSADRLYPSIFGEDEEAFDLWTKDMGIPSEKITRFYRDENGKSDNFWEHGAGPCGPCSEIYYDRGERFGCGKPDCKVGCECDRYMEVWNNVFTQFNGDGHGHYEELSNKNIDTGMGLERLAVVVQDVESVFDVDTMKAIRDRICEIAGIVYESDPGKDMSIRLITDHIRSATFLICDGVMPSNEGRGYVLRRLIRRAARHGRLLLQDRGGDLKGRFLSELSKTVIAANHDGYPELLEQQTSILKVLEQEESKFNETIDQGLGILAGMQDKMKQAHESVLSGEDAFRLYDTYGFPLDLTREIMEEQGVSVDEERFNAAMERQRKTARAARKETNYMGADATVYDEIPPEITTEFVGYEHTQYHSDILVIAAEDSLKDTISAGQQGSILVKETPFYATMGGQEADTGIISLGENVFVVENTIKIMGNRFAHVGQVKKGTFSIGDTVMLAIDVVRRDLTRRNHSATHLLQKALREVLGDHVQQQGSYVNQDRLRFDFSHFAPMTEEEIGRVEALVNEKIAGALPVHTTIMNMEAAKAAGAMALFGEKYADLVRVVEMGDYSKELCGGTHVSNTAAITAFKIVSESGIAAGVRRIEALTSGGVFAYYDKLEEQLKEAAKLAKTTPAALTERITGLLADIKKLQNENEALKSKAAAESLGDVMDQVTEIKGVPTLAVSVAGVDGNSLRELGDQLKDKLTGGIIVLASEKDGKVSLVAMASEEAIAKGAHAGNLIKAIAGKVGGGGGGRPNMAQAGGKNPAGISEAIAEAKVVVEGQVHG
ncbi:alanine--tRNA ligase [Clostridia bacterium]|nr:alanine--tRNA ligase [Clostridia bacterium]